MSGKRIHHSAFTLLELLLVMLLVAIMAGMMAPQLTGFTQGRKLTDAARMVVGLAQYARTEAAANGQVYRLNFDTSTRTYWLTSDYGSGYQMLTSVDFGKKFTLPDNIIFSELDINPQPNTQMNLPDSVHQDSVQQAPPMGANAANGTVGTILVNTHDEGAPYVEFRPTGRNDPVTITLQDESTGKKIQMACQSPTEVLRVTP